MDAGCRLGPVTWALARSYGARLGVPVPSRGRERW